VRVIGELFWGGQSRSCPEVDATSTVSEVLRHGVIQLHGCIYRKKCFVHAACNKFVRSVLATSSVHVTWFDPSLCCVHWVVFVVLIHKCQLHQLVLDLTIFIFIFISFIVHLLYIYYLGLKTFSHSSALNGWHVCAMVFLSSAL
jgi:hypothetical protein